MPYWLEKLFEIKWTEIRDELVAVADEVGGWLVGAPIDESAAQPFDPGNYVVFVDRRGTVRARLHDLNGFHLLETLIRRGLSLAIDRELEQHLAEFGDGTLCGWWKESQLTSGRPYFRGRRPTKIVHDVDDTAWWLKYRGRPAGDEQLRPFLSRDTLPRRFHDAAIEAKVDRRFVLRTWEHADWHKWDCDLLCMANMITALPEDGNELQRRVFEENQKLINASIPGRYLDLMMYYEPKVVGVFLLLFYDRAHRPFLTERSRDVLRRHLERELDQLESNEIRSRWAGDERLTYVHGYNLQWMNATLPGLCVDYSKRFLLGESSSARHSLVDALRATS
ncbi:hypothetical protein [Sandaracinus amylolyticus]|uniref:hypothetical protein n=1 Tax=Sandaracinus amylolyticus TaxID=927083 RepID=UPI001F308DBF|nr:hypothetical protein [Sandaracinus amylolyticus]UJR84164.1 Hypothetical protein I5071_62350 [Sandaracinus amylolyticus]